LNSRAICFRIPVIFSTAYYNINQILDLTVFNHIMDAQGFTESEYMALQGIYTGKYDPLINVPMSIPYANLTLKAAPALFPHHYIEAP